MNFLVCFFVILALFCCRGNATANVASISAIQTSLTSLLAYWPLTRNFMARDATSSNVIDGTYQNASLFVSGTGPFGHADSAIQMTHPTGYVSITSTQLDFGASSWTLAIFVKMTASNGPIYEWEYSPPYGAHLWQYSTADTLFVNTAFGSDSMNCSLNGVWQFVALVYDHSSTSAKLFCNETFSSPSVVSGGNGPRTTNLLLIGKRFPEATGTTADSAYFACGSAFTSALTQSELLQVKQLCPLYHDISCSANCQADTCRATLANSDGYECICQSGWTGSTCNTAICSPACDNGGTCSAPNTCSCPTGYFGATCSSSSCSPSCPAGLFCVAPPSQCQSWSSDSLCTTVRPDSYAACSAWKSLGQCYTNSEFMWPSCQTSCRLYATCDCTASPIEALDSNCTCGDWASAGLCETDTVVQSNCSFTCPRRLDASKNCSSVPTGVTLPPNTEWSLSSPPSASFLGQAAYLQAAIMVCQIGYVIQQAGQNGMHVCDPFAPNATTGNWVELNSNKPTCLPLACQPPPYIAGGSFVNYTNETNFYKYDRVTYSCDDGYEMQNAIVPDAQCSFVEPTGWTWQDNKPECILPPCQSLPDGINTIYNVSANQTGGIAMYSCNMGYDPKVELTFFIKTCQNDGSWTPVEVPSCEIVTCGRPTLEPNAYFIGEKATSTYLYGESVETRCSQGAYSLYIEPGTENTPLASVTNKCTEKGVWSTNELACLLVQCQSPAKYEIANYRIMNESSQLQNLLFGTIILFECDWNQGFEPTANQTLKRASWRCNENSTWDKQELLCSQSALLDRLKAVAVDQATEQSVAVATATTILAICGMFFAFIICLDYMTLSRDLRKIRHNLSHCRKRLRDFTRVRELHHVRERVRNVIATDIYLKRVDECKEKQQLTAAGYAVGGNAETGLVANPQVAAGNGDSATIRPFSSGKTKQQHVDGQIDVLSSDM